MHADRRFLAFSVVFSVSAALAGCGSDGGSGDEGTGSGPEAPPPKGENDFEIVTPDIQIAAGDERTYCYYTTIDTDQALGVKRWSSTMTPGSHHLIVYFTSDANEPDGTVIENCGVANGANPLNLPIWTYSAQTPEAENVMPDGVGMKVGVQQHLFVQMHYFNPTAEDIDAHVVVKGQAYDTDESYTSAAAFITFNTQIDLPPHGTGSAEGSCTVPAGVSFFTLSTHAHRRATRTTVSDGSTLVFESDDWEHPGATDWRAPPHYTFGSKLAYHCEYQNDLDQPVTTGDSADTDEMCMAVGYFFPAESPKFCLNSSVF